MSLKSLGKMAEVSNKFLEGVFAINKPSSLSSAQVLRDLQNKFAESTIFAPLLRETKRKEKEQERHQSKRRKRRGDDHVFKMGHGGTLDPLATGVLIVGIGKGTKHLNNFLGCTKTYETVVLFGKSTDTYDIAGKIVANAPTAHVDKLLVEDRLGQFRGKIKQVPPLYSALKIQGMKAYEYARTGKPLPRELESRQMDVEECTLLDWYNEGEHDFRWPVEEAPEVDKAAALKLMHGGEAANSESQLQDAEKGAQIDEKRMDISVARQQAAEETKSQLDIPSLKDGELINQKSEASRVYKAAMHTHDLPPLSSIPAAAPAARIRLTVSSGFYVRSFAHDLGIACNSYGIMSELTRSRQAEFTLLDTPPEGLLPALAYEDLGKGEEIWGPKISRVLEQWISSQVDMTSISRSDDRDRLKSNHNRNGSSRARRTTASKRKRIDGPGDDSDHNERRNTSSGE